MANSLMTGVSGLLAHRAMLDVVGNNLANLNTSGFKASSVIFADLVYETLRAPTAGVSGQRGGTNPMQVGHGVRLAGISQNFRQGELQLTGGMLDMAIDGNGFFVLSNGLEQSFTRAGAFALDANGILVNPTTGDRVVRLGTIGEPGVSQPGFQVPGDDSIRIPLGAVISGQQTETVTIQGNLSPSHRPPVNEQLASGLPWTVGGNPAAGSDLLNSLDGVTVPYGAGDAIEITGTDADGAPISTTFSVDGTTTLADLVGAISAAFGGATASLDVGGHLVLEADEPGNALLTLSLDNAAGTAGNYDFAGVTMGVTVAGDEGDVTRHALDVFDAQGNAHRLVFEFRKESDNVWSMTTTSTDGTVIDGVVRGIEMNEDGSFRGVTGTGIDDATIVIQYPGITEPLTLNLDFGQAGGFGGLTQIAGLSALTSSQDGFSPGALSTVFVNSDGVVMGVATNGRNIELAQLAIAHFRNPQGLLARGNNQYVATLNSGPVELGAGLSGGRGSVLSGQLESSNVEIAQEFTRLIIAQRGFQANSRTISVTNQILDELSNLIR